MGYTHTSPTLSAVGAQAAGGHWIMFVVIKQSLFDLQLSDTECVQALVVLVEESTKTSKTLLLAKFSLLELALHQQLFIRDFLALHFTGTESSELTRPVQACPLTGTRDQTSPASFINSSFTVIFPN